MLNQSPTFGDTRLPPRFWAKVRFGSVPAHRPDLGPCWEWSGCQDGRGYGRFWVAERMRPAHWVAYEALIGPIPQELESDHLCRNHPCVNPSHVEPVTHSENMRRSPLNRGEANGQHKLTEGDVRTIRALRGRVSQRTIAAWFGVVRPTVSVIQCGKRWGWCYPRHSRDPWHPRVPNP